MTSRGPGRASRSPEMEEKEQLRRQIRLLQGLIDDYKNLHGDAAAPGASAAPRWRPPAYHSGRAFAARCLRPGRRGFAPHRGPAWRKKYSLVNRPLGSTDPPGDRTVQPTLGAEASQGPDPQPCVLERQVQLSPDQNMVIKIKPPSKLDSAGAPGPQRYPLEGPEGTCWSDQRPQVGEGEPPGCRVENHCSGEDALLVCEKEPGRPRVVRSVSGMSRSPPEPRHTASEGAIAAKAQRGGGAPGRKAGVLSAASCAARLLGDGRVDAGHPDQTALLGLAVVPARATPGPRQARETSQLVSCRTSKFRKNNYKWVASSAKSPRTARKALSPRVAAENTCKASVSGAERAGKPQLKADTDAKPRRAMPLPKPGVSPSKYKWKAASPSASSAFHWQPEAGPQDRAAPLSPVLLQSPPEDRPAAGPSSLPLGETSLLGYKVKSRTKIVRRRGGASLSGDKKTSQPAAPAKSPFSLQRRQAPRGKSSPVLKKTPNKGLLQVTRHRLCRLPPGRAHLPTKEACSPHSQRTPAPGKVIKTRYRIVKKGSATLLGTLPCHVALPTWRARRLSLPRSPALNRLRPAPTGAAGKVLPSAPRWRSRGYRCIGGVLYRVSANKLSKTSGQPSDGVSRPSPRTGRSDPASSCSRSLASRAIQRSLAVIRQARQKKRGRRAEYCMYYNRFGRCSRGRHCPYIHDPEKVAVCTRFLRGTCKKTDGTCPFSHHVSKDKMPVCSYFLKGICSNSDCPYSHVYVSRKAEVCKDFLKGYCPLGAKCKKKHALLCPDFSRRGTCPRGTQCQLPHRSQKRAGRRASPAAPPGDVLPRSRTSTGPGSRKPSAAQRPPRPTPGSPSSAGAAPALPSATPAGLASSSDSQVLSLAASSSTPSSSSSPASPASRDPEVASVQEAASAVTGSGSLPRLPSFISLRSSPSPARQPSARAHRSPPPRDAGRSLHIKPRL